MNKNSSETQPSSSKGPSKPPQQQGFDTRLDEKSLTLTSFSSGDFNRVFYGLKESHCFQQNIFLIFLETHRSTTPLMLQLMLQPVSWTRKLKLCPSKTKTIVSIQSNVDGFHKLKTPTSESELIRFIDLMNFYFNFI